MKKVLIPLLVVCFLSGCRTQLSRPLKGNYSSEYTASSDGPYDAVWNNIINYCVKKDISLKLIDKKSGVIISEPYEIRTFTFERPDGTPEMASANVILGCETIRGFRNDCQPPSGIVTDVIFKVKKENNKTLITIMLSDITAWYARGTRCLRDVKSTGFLEKQLMEEIQ